MTKPTITEVSVHNDLQDLQSVMEDLEKRYDKMPLNIKIDLAARLRAACKTIDAIDGAVKDEIKRQLHNREGVVLGDLFKAQLNEIPTTCFDQKGLKEEKPEVFADYQYTEKRLRITFEPR